MLQGEIFDEKNNYNTEYTGFHKYSYNNRQQGFCTRSGDKFHNAEYPANNFNVGLSMKKYILSFLLILCISSQALAYNYDTKFKKNFYDEFVANYFQTLQQSLLNDNYKDESAYQYVSTLRARLNRKDLENMTWACVSQYSEKQMAQSKDFTEKCFGKWSQKFMFEQNADTISILKRK